MQNLVKKILLIVAILALCVFAIIPPEEKIRLGKDLRGGVSLIYRVTIPEGADRSAVITQTIEVLKDVPVRLYLTRLHREHVNQFAIEPFYRSNDVILPGEIGLIEFVPDRVGEFAIRNVGHGFEATLVVVETVAELKQLMVDRGVKMFALIQSAGDSRLFPERTLVVKDVPVKVFNISLTEEHSVSVSPFYDPAELNVRPREITSFDFTPNRAGTFAIESAIYGYQGTLVVEDPG